MDTVIVPNTFSGRIKCFSSNKVYSDNMSLSMFILQCENDKHNYQEWNNDILSIETTILRQNLGNHEHGICISLNTQFGASLDSVFKFEKVTMKGNLESSSTRNYRFVFNGILDSTETIPDSIINLDNGVGIGS